MAKFVEHDDGSVTVTLDFTASERQLSAHNVTADITSIVDAGIKYLLANGWNGAITDSVSGHKGKYEEEGLDPDTIAAKLDATRQAKGQAICEGSMRLGGGGGARLSERDKMIRDAALAYLAKRVDVPKKLRDAQPLVDALLAKPEGRKIVAQVDAMLALLAGDDEGLEGEASPPRKGKGE